MIDWDCSMGYYQGLYMTFVGKHFKKLYLGRQMRRWKDY
jgi:hypothetical protein